MVLYLLISHVEQWSTPTCTHAHRQRINMTQCLSMKMGGGAICFPPLPAHTHMNMHMHCNTPSWLEGGVCVCRGEGMRLRWDMQTLTTPSLRISPVSLRTRERLLVPKGRWSFCTQRAFYLTVSGEESRVRTSAWWVSDSVARFLMSYWL